MFNPESTMDALGAWVMPLTVAVVALVLLLLFKVFKLYRLLGVIFVPNDQVCMLIKKWGWRRLANGRIVATNGEAGIQAETLSPGLHFWYWPWQFNVKFAALTVIEPGTQGEVEVIDGEAIGGGFLLARHVDCNNFQDFSAFLRNGGQKGPQSSVLTPGRWRINTLCVKVKSTEALVVPPNKVAVITTMDGNPLNEGTIAGPTVPGHSSFQNYDAFIKNGGQRGLQTQVVLSGTYYVNTKFVQHELVDLQEVQIGHAGVVVSFVGDEGEDQSGESFTHGHIVKNGQRGVWVVPLNPGRFPLNPRTVHMEPVQTTNFVINFITSITEAHGLDASLKTLDVRSMDGFDYPIEVSQILHIAAENAPKVIARFGTVLSFVTQVMEPIIDNWFRNAAQSRKLIDFLQKREEIQGAAATYIEAALARYDIEAVGTLIGSIDPPSDLTEPLRKREIAEQQKAMYVTQKEAQTQRIETESERAKADTIEQVIKAQRSVEVANQYAFEVKKKAEGDAAVITQLGDAQAGKIAAVGNAEAAVLQAKVSAIGNQNWTVMDIISKLAEAKTPLVPTIVTAGEGGATSPIMALMLSRLNLGASATGESR